MFAGENEDISRNMFPKPAETKKKRKQKEDIDTNNEELLKLAKNTLQKPRNMDEYDAYAVTVGAKLRKMSNHQCLLAQLHMDQILFNGILGRLVEGSPSFYTSSQSSVSNQWQNSSSTSSTQSIPASLPSPTSYEYSQISPQATAIPQYSPNIYEHSQISPHSEQSTVIFPQSATTPLQLPNYYEHSQASPHSQQSANSLHPQESEKELGELLVFHRK